MTEYGAPFEGILIGDAAAVAPYSSLEWARIWKLQHGSGMSFLNYGVFLGSGDGTHQPLEVDATVIVSATVQVQIGAADVNGRFYENTAVVTLPVGANSSGNARIDTVVLRADYVAQTIRLVIKQGTPAASPARVAMQQDTSIWEIPLADIAVANGFSTLAQSTITQRQRYINTQGAGWQADAFPPGYAIGMGIGNSFTLTAAQTVLIPIGLYGNMLLRTVIFRSLSVTDINVGWDLYIEDTDDSNTSENFLRRIAKSAANVIVAAPGAAANYSCPSLAPPTPLPPGQYWLAFQNRHASNSFILDSSINNLFDNAASVSTSRRKVTTNPNGAALDAFTGWTAGVQPVLCVFLNGRVFGDPN